MISYILHRAHRSQNMLLKNKAKSKLFKSFISLLTSFHDKKYQSSISFSMTALWLLHLRHFKLTYMAVYWPHQSFTIIKQPKRSNKVVNL